jgi:hypothetical protein
MTLDNKTLAAVASIMVLVAVLPKLFRQNAQSEIIALRKQLRDGIVLEGDRA